VLPGGLALRGLSGGERRRVSVAIGCLAHPKILFLDGGAGIGTGGGAQIRAAEWACSRPAGRPARDQPRRLLPRTKLGLRRLARPPTARARAPTSETRPPRPAEPTSGLDACSALAVVEHLRDRAADSGLTIVASIHQPRASVWAAFNSVSILSGGLLMYAGPASGLLPWFEGGLGYGPWEADAHGAVADWAIDLVNVGFTKPAVSARSFWGVCVGGSPHHRAFECACRPVLPCRSSPALAVASRTPRRHLERRKGHHFDPTKAFPPSPTQTAQSDVRPRHRESR
jgi:hypothetical protein